MVYMYVRVDNKLIVINFVSFGKILKIKIIHRKTAAQRNVPIFAFVHQLLFFKKNDLKSIEEVSWIMYCLKVTFY